tara:strand:+ start:2536 stop:2742 length:207 start_codon:yes stop_codon:yes gene_type:complete
MGNIKGAKWYLILYYNTDKNEVFKILRFDTIKEMSFVLGLSPQVISNYYHGLIKERDCLKYCSVKQIK